MPKLLLLENQANKPRFVNWKWIGESRVACDLGMPTTIVIPVSRRINLLTRSVSSPLATVSAMMMVSSPDNRSANGYLAVATSSSAK